jgi:hypothetical protein
MKSPFRYFNSSPEVIRLVVMMYVKFPLSLRKGGIQIVSQPTAQRSAP